MGRHVGHGYSPCQSALVHMTMIFFTWFLLLISDKRKTKLCEFGMKYVPCHISMYDIKSMSAYLIAHALWQPFVHVEREPGLRSLVPWSKNNHRHEIKVKRKTFWNSTIAPHYATCNNVTDLIMVLSSPPNSTPKISTLETAFHSSVSLPSAVVTW